MVTALVITLLFAAQPGDFNDYLGEVRKRIEAKWQYPAKSDKLQATVKFTLDRAGRVTQLTVTKSSGNKNFDDSVLDAVRSATPFGSLITILKKSETRNVELTFRRKSVAIEGAKSAPVPKKP
jgi:TonB family protein